MGEYYEVAMLCGIYYVEFQNGETDWEQRAIKMTPEQLEEYEDLQDRHAREEQELLASFV